MQKHANLVELEKCCRTHIFLQNFVLMQPRTSPPKICKILQKSYKICQFCQICSREVAAEIVVLRGQLLEQTGRARIAQQALAQAKQSCEADIAFGAVLMTQGGGLGGD